MNMHSKPFERKLFAADKNVFWKMSGKLAFAGIMRMRFGFIINLFKNNHFAD